MATTKANEQAVLDWLATQKQPMLELLAELVNTDSGSYDKAGVDAVGARLEAFFAGEGLVTSREADATFGDAIHVRLDDQPTNEAPILLMGHRDTVFSKGEAARRPFRIEDQRAYGPGVSDMKGGLVINAFVLAAFKRLGGAPAPLAALITSDEEIGSPFCRAVIERTARSARLVLNSEPGRPSGNIVTARKGGVFMKLAITGKAAHSGGNFEAGHSAIGELAHKVVALHALTEIARGITVNVGIVKGGEAVNMVAPSAQAEIDLRYVEPTQRDEVMEKIQAIVAKAYVAGTRSELVIAGEFAPLNPTPASEALFREYQQAASAVGLAIEGEFSGGCSDAGITAGVGCPTLCAVGPVGGKAHTPEEYLEVESLVPRAQAMALTILRHGSAAPAVGG